MPGESAYRTRGYYEPNQPLSSHGDWQIHTERADAPLRIAMEYLESNARYSKAVIHGDTVYLAGQVASDASADIKGQTRQVLDQVDSLLARSGTDKTRVISALVLLKDMRDLETFNEVWDAWTVPGRTPARTPMEVRLADPCFLVEVQVVAAR